MLPVGTSYIRFYDYFISRDRQYVTYVGLTKDKIEVKKIFNQQQLHYMLQEIKDVYFSKDEELLTKELMFYPIGKYLPVYVSHHTVNNKTYENFNFKQKKTWDAPYTIMQGEE